MHQFLVVASTSHGNKHCVIYGLLLPIPGGLSHLVKRKPGPKKNPHKMPSFKQGSAISQDLLCQISRCQKLKGTVSLKITILLSFTHLNVISKTDCLLLSTKWTFLRISRQLIFINLKKLLNEAFINLQK